MLLSRHLSVESFGRYTFYLAVFALLDSLTDFGTGAVAVQRTAGDPGAVAGVLRAGRRIRLALAGGCLLYTSPSPRDQRGSRMPSSA